MLKSAQAYAAIIMLQKISSCTNTCVQKKKEKSITFIYGCVGRECCGSENSNQWMEVDLEYSICMLENISINVNAQNKVFD